MLVFPSPVGRVRNVFLQEQEWREEYAVLFVVEYCAYADMCMETRAFPLVLCSLRNYTPWSHVHKFFGAMSKQKILSLINVWKGFNLTK